ncbi:XdhC family protein [Qipengyuania spongiae]|uniref:XdhC family protein n=1 Tax=Qipengyuania spongiae TaxID=2909673 RepID=A0ABY5T0G6_9SPHN|nr:XdhC family protein [Qipengyuania spongiae]UVI40290.1 XdhC family protein [Qipengyuania spongiae]
MAQAEEAVGDVGVGGWPVHGLEDDVRPRMFAVADAGEVFALATIVAADGGPRPEGAQMVVTNAAAYGFLSGGCIEDDVARHGREVIDGGDPRTLVYGEGSPFIDIRLPCGGRIEVAIERVPPDDPALQNLRELTGARRPAMWLSDGETRFCVGIEEAGAASRYPIERRHDPVQRLVVVGSDPFALAIAGMGRAVGWDTVLLSPFGPTGDPPFGVSCNRRPLSEAFGDLDLDLWTAVAVATHDLEADRDALVPSLLSPAGYVGVLGSRRKLGQRREGLAAAGLSEAQIARLHAPIGIPIPAASPWEVAVSVVGEIIAQRRDAKRGRTSGEQRLNAAA